MTEGVQQSWNQVMRYDNDVSQEHRLDHAAMLAMRTVLAFQPALDCGPVTRPGFDGPQSIRVCAEGTRSGFRLNRPGVFPRLTAMQIRFACFRQPNIMPSQTRRTLADSQGTIILLLQE
jgi:hypothetical protein